MPEVLHEVSGRAGWHRVVRAAKVASVLDRRLTLEDPDRALGQVRAIIRAGHLRAGFHHHLARRLRRIRD